MAAALEFLLWLERDLVDRFWKLPVYTRVQALEPGVGVLFKESFLAIGQRGERYMLN
jgi:hypothetical protein